MRGGTLAAPELKSPAPAAPWPDALLAARLLAADPGLGGALVRAPAGTVRDAWLAAYRAAAGGAVIKLPLGVDDARLLGGVDLAATLAAGRPVASRGMLAEAAGGTLIVTMAERIDAGLAGRLAAAVDAGVVRLILLDEGEGGGEEVAPAALAERCAFWLDLTAVPPGAADERSGSWPTAERMGLPALGPADAAIDLLCATAFAYGVASSRAGLFAVRAARALAAQAGRTAVTDDDTAAAARLVIGPRATRLPASPEQSPQEAEVPPPGDAAAAPPNTPAPPLAPNTTDSDRPDDTGDEDTGDEDRAAPPTATPTDRMVEAVRATLPPGLLAALAAGAAPPGRGGGSGALRRGAARGRPLPSRVGAPRGSQRLALIDTLRAAAPWQGLRRPPATTKVVVRRDDFRVSRFAERTGTTTIFAVDASGSAAVARLAEAKGAVELLLAEAYVARTQVALVAFRGTAAAVVLPPTRSLARAKRALGDLAGGGGTPLAAGLAAAAAVAAAERARGRSPFVVVLTDGRANIARDGTASRERAGADATTAARGFVAARIAAVFIDTSIRPRPEGAALAAAMGARYAPLPAAGAAAMAGVVRALSPAASR